MARRSDYFSVATVSSDSGSVDGIVSVSHVVVAAVIVARAVADSFVAFLVLCSRSCPNRRRHRRPVLALSLDGFRSLF